MNSDKIEKIVLESISSIEIEDKNYSQDENNLIINSIQKQIEKYEFIKLIIEFHNKSTLEVNDEHKKQI